MTDVEEMNTEAQEGETQAVELDSMDQVKAGTDVPQDDKKKRTYTRRVPAVALVREPGKSLLPFSRVQKIVKADKEIPIVAKDATFLISLATEEFIKRLVGAGKMVAEREKRATVQHKDIATVVRRVDEFLFLEEIIPWMSAEPPTKRKPRGTDSRAIKGQPTMDRFVVNTTNQEEGYSTVSEQVNKDIIMNEDGTMGAPGGGTDDYE